MDEFKEAKVLANKLLDEPNADPYDSLRLLSRQFLRACGEIPDVYYIEFGTQSEPGKLGAVKIAIGYETITDMERPLNIALCNHPLYSKLVGYVKANPAG